ncbi:transcriptional regulator [Rhizobium tubonense]|uniref:Transcriptional regulator n=1 Tax=Rhizobium tubonense TaxID=484088 RepID=A0A2W4F4A3_9HYPH|nr:transcriptional regulator [Rhizobium tubonense]
MTQIEILKAISHRTRIEILTQLKRPEEHFADQGYPVAMGVCAGQFDRYGLSQSTVSAHLGTLHRAGLLTSKRIGQCVFYKRNEVTIAAFLDELDEMLSLDGALRSDTVQAKGPLIPA